MEAMVVDPAAVDKFVGTSFATAAPSLEQREVMEANRLKADDLARSFVTHGGTNACTRTAVRKLQEAVMYANRAVLEID